MSQVTVDPHRRIARIEAGALWRTVIDAAAAHGLAPLSGSSSGIGAVGYNLGGGMGLLGREHGFAADHVVSIDLVTADGRLCHVTEETEPDLFWAIRLHAYRSWAPTLDADTVEALLKAAGPHADLPLVMVEIRQLGGALSRPAAAPNAVSGRDGLFLGATTPQRLAQAWTPATHARLLAVKRAVDPTDLFRFGHALGV